MNDDELVTIHTGPEAEPEAVNAVMFQADETRIIHETTTCPDIRVYPSVSELERRMLVAGYVYELGTGMFVHKRRE